MRRRAIAAAPRAPGASVGDSSSTRRIAQGGLDQWRVRAFAGDARSDGFEKGGSGGRDAAADDDALDAEGQGERSDRSGQVVGHPVGDLDRDLVAGGTGAEDVRGARMGRQDGAATGSDRLVGLASDRRTGGDRLEAAAQTARADDALRIGDDVADLAGKAVVAAEQLPRRERRRPRCRCRSRGTRGSPAPGPSRRPPARSARGPPRGRRARRRPGCPALPAASVPAAGG